MKSFHKRGMLDDLFDLIFTVVISFFLLFFVNAALLNSVQQGQEASLREVAEANKIFSALANLRTQANTGPALDPAQIETKITQSQVLGGRVITDCYDYYASEDCNHDAVGLYAQSPDYCRWNEAQKVCQYVPEVVAS